MIVSEAVPPVHIPNYCGLKFILYLLSHVQNRKIIHLVFYARHLAFIWLKPQAVQLGGPVAVTKESGALFCHSNNI